MKRLLNAWGSAVLLALAAIPAAAQYPAKPVRLLVGFAPGGGVDIMARLLAQKLGERWGKPILVENRPGAAGNIATDMVAKSAPDGHTLLMAFSSHPSNPALYGSLPFNIDRDFTSITLVATAPVMIVASPAVGAVHVQADALPTRAERDALSAMRRGGTTVRWSGSPPTIAPSGPSGRCSRVSSRFSRTSRAAACARSSTVGVRSRSPSRT
jgi:tripartite-type tricarboxylate transporter receptor subunit TctC